MYTDQHNFIDAYTSRQLLAQLLGPRRFYLFAEEARMHLEGQNFIEWSPEFLADFISDELRKPEWEGRQPSIQQHQKLVAASRRRCREYAVLLPDSKVKMTVTRVNSIDDFDFAKAMLFDLLDYYASTSKNIPPVYTIVKGRKCYSEILLTIVLGGVLVEITFIKIGKHEKAS